MLSLLIALAATPAVAAESLPPLDPRVIQWQAIPNGQQFARFYRGGRTTPAGRAPRC